MKEWRFPVRQSPESVFVILGSDNGNADLNVIGGWVRGVLDKLNWRSHIYLVGGKATESEMLSRSLII